MGYLLSFFSPAGREWRLMDPNPNGVFIAEGALEGALIGARTDAPVTVVGRRGQKASSQDVTFAPITGNLPCVINEKYTNGQAVDQVWKNFRADWNATTPENPGTLKLSRSGGGEALFLPSRLNGIMTGPRANPSEADEIPLTVPVIGEDALWLQAMSAQGTVTVINNGVDFVHPRIRWSGAGGIVTLPSTARITLPPVTGERTLILDTAESFAVLDENGALDRDVWEQMPTIVAEGIPAGQSRTFSLPPSATLRWDLGFTDPWEVL